MAENDIIEIEIRRNPDKSESPSDDVESDFLFYSSIIEVTPKRPEGDPRIAAEVDHMPETLRSHGHTVVAAADSEYELQEPGHRDRFSVGLLVSSRTSQSVMRLGTSASKGDKADSR